MRRALLTLWCAGLCACGETSSTPPESTPIEDAAAASDASTGGDDAVDVTSPPAEDADVTTVTDTASEDGGGPLAPPTLCVAIRGNGELVTAHFAAMARIVETFGPLDGVAGGSSASITSFLTESMHMHPGVTTCGGSPCTKLQAGARLGLMYKTLYGYLAAMGDRDEAVAIGTLLDVVAQAQAEGIGALVEGGNFKDALDALKTLLSSQDVKDLVNPELLALLFDSPNPLDHVSEVWAAIATLGAFSADSAVIFLRSGLVSFKGLAEKIGRIGSFYAAYGPADLQAWEELFEVCALPGRGLPWPAVAALDAGNGETCGSLFSAMLKAWRDDFVPQEHDLQNRIDDPVGAHMRLLAITSALTGKAAATWEAAHDAYVAGEAWTMDVAFEDVRVGYWGQDAVTAAAVQNPLGFTDLKTSKALSLGQVPWRQVLSLSPAEPGLSRAYPMGQDRVSAGGWPDLAPVLALRNAGCDRVIYLTRRGAESKFARGVAKLAGMTEADDKALYDLGNPESSFNRSLEQAAGVWCTDWTAFSGTQRSELMAAAWGAPFELHDPALVPVEGDYPTTTADHIDLPGCTPELVP